MQFARVLDSQGEVPPRAGALSGLALLVPLLAQFSVVDSLMAQYEILLWLLVLVPPFLWAYYRGWRGAASALAAGMAVLSLSAGLSAALGRPLASWGTFFGLTTAYAAVSLGIGLVTELLHRERREAELRALTDPLTELPNRRFARAVLDQEFAAAQRGRPLTVIVWDLDHFKRYNDEYGHDAGDVALQMFADALRQTTRKMNLSARWGGEEFISVLGGCDVKGAAVFVERVRWMLLQAPIPGGRVRTSAGLAEHAPGYSSAEDLIAAADEALYDAKQQGRNRVVVARAPAADEDGTRTNGSPQRPAAGGGGWFAEPACA
ncbi:MAG: GGDEF domain-containing protein [Longimicrobiales bacterium]